MPLIFKQSLDLLVAIGWLEPAGETTKTRRYRLSASAIPGFDLAQVGRTGTI